jgi:oxygen-dependent protoporphyrinogen oxidase
MAQPLVSSIYTADADKLSLQATMPQFLEMEERDRSIIHAMWKNRRLLRRQGVNTAKDAGARYGLFNTLRDGLGSLIDELARRLPPGCVELGMVGTGIRSRAGSDAGLPRWEIQIEGGESLAADGVCLALPAPRAGAIVRSLATAPALKLADELEQISYASSAIVNLAYRRTDVAHPLDGMGFVAPSTAGRGLLACSFSSVKFPGRSPADTVLLRAFVGGAVQAERYAASDDDMRAAVEADLEEILGIRARPFFTQMSRHPETMAQYHLGHLDRVASIEEAVAKLPGIALAGNGYRGIGMPDCVHSAEQAVQSIIEELPTA